MNHCSKLWLWIAVGVGAIALIIMIVCLSGSTEKVRMLWTLEDAVRFLWRGKSKVEPADSSELNKTAVKNKQEPPTTTDAKDATKDPSKPGYTERMKEYWNGMETSVSALPLAVPRLAIFTPGGRNFVGVFEIYCPPPPAETLMETWQQVQISRLYSIL